MGYSIYINITEGGLKQIQENCHDFPYLSEFFKPAYRQKVDNGYLFGWIKPYKSGTQVENEKAFFEECLLLDSAGNLARIAHDDTVNGESLGNKCIKKLHKHIGKDVF